MKGRKGNRMTKNKEKERKEKEIVRKKEDDVEGMEGWSIRQLTRGAGGSK